MTFSPLAWLKLLMFLHAGDTEIGGFGVSSQNDPLYIEDFVTVKQSVTAVTVAFDDASVADYFDGCIDRGLMPNRFARIWVHTHPGSSPDPSSVDEETFARVFGECDWSVMLIVSRTHATYARLSFSAGPGGSILAPVTVDWAKWPQTLLEHGAELSGMFEAWMDEYGKNIFPLPAPQPHSHPHPHRHPRLDPVVAFRSELDASPDRTPWRDQWWREDDLYGGHEQLAMEDDVVECFEASMTEERWAS